MTTLDHMDPFATLSTLGGGDDDPFGIRGGRYRLPDLAKGVDGKLITGDGPRKGGWQRVTNLVKAIADARALDLWHQRQIIAGLVLRPDIYDLACATLSGQDLTNPSGTLRAELEQIAQKALSAAGSDVGANLGTAFHGFAEAQDLGMPHYARKRWEGRLQNYGSGMRAHRLEVVPGMTERRIVVLRYGVAGTLDRVLNDLESGVLRIGDLKTQKRFWTWLEISAQLAAYQMADAMWDERDLCYVQFPRVADDYAVVAWIPQIHPEREDQVDFFDVDLSFGRDVLEVSFRANELRSEARSAGQTIGLLRPLPELSLVETYARRLDGVESPHEGSVLWGEIVGRGLGATPELLDLARAVAQRFQKTG